MLVDAAVFAVACAVLVSMPQLPRPQHALESVALSTALEDIALAAAVQSELVASACDSVEGEVALKQAFENATNAFAAITFSVHCPFGKVIPLSDTPVPVNSTESIFTNRVTVPKNGNAFLVLFEAQSAAGS